MSDYGVCKGNLDRLLQNHELDPFSQREMAIAAMQFDYCSTEELYEEYEDHPMVQLLIKEGYLM